MEPLILKQRLATTAPKQVVIVFPQLSAPHQSCSFFLPLTLNFHSLSPLSLSLSLSLSLFSLSLSLSLPLSFYSLSSLSPLSFSLSYFLSLSVSFSPLLSLSLSSLSFSLSLPLSLSLSTTPAVHFLFDVQNILRDADTIKQIEEPCPTVHIVTHSSNNSFIHSFIHSISSTYIFQSFMLWSHYLRFSPLRAFFFYISFVGLWHFSVAAR